MSEKRISHVPEQRGSIALLILILLVVLVGAGAFAVDIGNLYRVRNELQNAADAAALAGAAELNGTLDGIDNAFAAAASYVDNNNNTGYPIEIAADDVAFGQWDAETHVLSVLEPDEDNISRITAMRVHAKRTDERNGPVSNFLAPILGIGTTAVSAIATAIGGGPMDIACGFPLAVSECALTSTPDTLNNCEYCMVFQNDNADSGGWTGFKSRGGIDGNTLAGLVVDACYENGVLAKNADNECDGSQCLSRGINDGAVQVGNGNIMNTGNNKCTPDDDMSRCNNPCPVIQDILTLRGVLPDDDAESFVVTVPVFREGDGSCDNVSYSGQKDIAGYATLEIFAARCGQSTGDRTVTVASPPANCIPSASGDYLGAVLHCGMTEPTLAGGGSFGLTALRTRLVQ